MKRLTILLPVILVLALIQGCSKSSSSSAAAASLASVRLVNGTGSTLDMDTSSTPLVTAVAPGSASSYVAIGSGTVPISLNLTNSGIGAFSQNYTLAASNYTILAYTDYSSGVATLQGVPLVENQTAPAAGTGALLRIYDLATNAGNFDIYVAPAGNTSSSPIAANSRGMTNFYPIAAAAAGTNYHIWVTGTGNSADVRLDLPSVAISDQQVLTLALTSTSGGVLVDGLLIAQQGAVNSEKNTSARIRVAAGFTASGVVTSATANGKSLLSSPLTTPSVGSYALIPAGPLTISVNSAPAVISSSLNTAAAGADLTLLAVGSTATPTYYVVNDDNTLPSNGNAKLRLVNGYNPNTLLPLTYNFQSLASNVSIGTASAPVNVTSGISSNISVGALYTSQTIYPTGITLQSQGVYSVFMLGDSSLASPGSLIRDN